MAITMAAARRLFLPSCGAMSLDLSLSFSRYISSGLREERDTFGPIHVPEDRFFRRLLCSCALCIPLSFGISLSLSILSCVFLLCSCNGCVFKTFRKDLIRVFWLYFDS
jgi:hypothetical protein